MGLHKAANVARGLDNVLNKFILAFAILLFLFGAYVIWDNMRIESMAVNNDFVQYKPQLGKPETYTLAELKKINPDVCGWITVDNTHIDYPVVHGKDNMEYINKDVKGGFSYSGSIFIDSENNPNLSDPYILIFGHHMNKDGMFSDVSKFLDQDFLEKHQTGHLFGEGFVKNIRFFACCPLSASDARVYNVESAINDGTPVLLSYVRQKAKTYVPGKVYTSGDVVALSTCADATTNGRIVLFGVVQ